MRAAAALYLFAALLALAGPAAAQDAAPAEEAAARAALDAFGACVAMRDPDESLRVIDSDFRTAAYRTGLRMLADEHGRECAPDAVGRRNIMRSSNLLMAGAIAESLLEQRSDAVPLQLLRAAEAQPETFAPTDAVAQCLARSLPDQVGALFASVPGDATEAEAARPLFAAVEPCSQAAALDARLEMSVPALRAMIATAALRLVAHSES